MSFKDMQAEYAATTRTNTDNFRTTEIFKREKRMKALGAGLKACLDSGLTRAEIHGLVDTVFDDAGKA